MMYLRKIIDEFGKLSSTFFHRVNCEEIWGKSVGDAAYPRRPIPWKKTEVACPVDVKGPAATSETASLSAEVGVSPPARCESGSL